MKTSLKWATCDNLGTIAFPTKKATLEKYPDRVARSVDLGLGGCGWIALEIYGTENRNTIKTPDGREIPVVHGWSDKGHLIGMRGGSPQYFLWDYWQAIMRRVVEEGLRP